MPKNNTELIIDYPYTPSARRAGGGTTTPVGGATSLLGLSDTPSSYAGRALYLLRVNSGESAVEFGVLATATPTADAVIVADPDGKIGAGWIDDADISKAFTELTDVPSSYSGHGLKLVRVNAGENALEFVSSSGSGYTQEEIEDFVAAQFTGNTGVIDATYDDGTGAITLTLDVSGANKYLYSTGADAWAEGDITAFMRGLLDDSDAATARTTLGLVIGTNVQAYDATLASIAALGTVADRMLYTTGTDTWAEATLTSFARTLLAAAADSNARTTLGLGTMATQAETAYALLAGRSGGQSLIGGTASGNNLTLRSTSNATRGKIVFGNAGTTAYDEVNDRLGVKTATPEEALHVNGNILTNNGQFYKSKMSDGTTLVRIFGVGGDDIAYFGGIDSAITQMRVRISGTDNLVVLPTAFGIGLTAATARLHVLQATLGNAVQRLQSTATNDDPTEDTMQGRVATTDAAFTNIFTYAVPATTTVVLVATVSARRTGGASGTAEDGAGYVMAATVKNVAGTATLIGQTMMAQHESQAGWDAQFNVSGGNAIVEVKGAASNNVSWHATVRVYPVST